jgi:hypothetical protein
MQTSFILPIVSGSTEMSTQGFAGYFVFRPALRGAILFGGAPKV